MKKKNKQENQNDTISVISNSDGVLFTMYKKIFFGYEDFLHFYQMHIQLRSCLCLYSLLSPSTINLSYTRLLSHQSQLELR